MPNYLLRLVNPLKKNNRNIINNIKTIGYTIKKFTMMANKRNLTYF